ncbi:TetR/AcrR family transcriptional regulator [Gangjinia marincola]|uniref:TetR/AcrR family transcriptional regulator n=1 Tax=Gangjinia marincola TaxID=578463 RepID=A0ABP3XUA9_9FLAO
MARTLAFNKEDILDKVTKLFWLKGFNGTSMQDLVEVTRLNRSSIYNTFGSKEELYQAALSHYLSKNQDHFKPAVNATSNYKKAIRAIFESYLDEITTDKDQKGCMTIGCLTEMGNQNTTIAEWLSHNDQQMQKIFGTLVQKGKESGEIITTIETPILTNYLISSFQGLRVRGMSITDRKTLQGIINTIMNAIH